MALSAEESCSSVVRCSGVVVVSEPVSAEVQSVLVVGVGPDAAGDAEASSVAAGGAVVSPADVTTGDDAAGAVVVVAGGGADFAGGVDAGRKPEPGGMYCGAGWRPPVESVPAPIPPGGTGLPRDARLD